ncbi:MAG: hypothetical protein OXQ29_12935 [Rhodospirillaceae bacterium]|nr:hypothetical protein [Rhodospirillaceae bacterium]
MRHYTLSDEDLQNSGAGRRPGNKLELRPAAVRAGPPWAAWLPGEFVGQLPHASGGGLQGCPVPVKRWRGDRRRGRGPAGDQRDRRRLPGQVVRDPSGSSSGVPAPDPAGVGGDVPDAGWRSGNAEP